MVTYKKLKEKPTLFKNLTGITVLEFNQLLQQLEPVWLQMNFQRLNYPNRQRCVGGGPDYKLRLTERLLMTVILLHLYPNTNALSLLFDVNKSTVSRNTRNILPVLYQLNDGRWSKPPKRGEGKCIEQIVQNHPDLLEIVDLIK